MYRLAPIGVVRLADGQLIKPGEPGWEDYRAWHRDGNEPLPEEIPPRWPDIETARAEVRAAINAERDRREATTFPYLGRDIDSTPRAVARITTSVQAAQAALASGWAYEVEWTCADNSDLPLDAAGVIGLPVALALHAAALHAAAKRMKAWAESATQAELEAFDAATAPGWPS